MRRTLPLIIKVRLARTRASRLGPVRASPKTSPADRRAHTHTRSRAEDNDDDVVGDVFDCRSCPVRVIARISDGDTPMLIAH